MRCALVPSLVVSGLFFLPIVGLGVDKCSPSQSGSVTAEPASQQDSWSECNGSYVERYSMPRGAVAFPFLDQVMTAPYGGYSTSLTKVDIIWAAETITINSPLRSFGGDIILYANKITINAPLDTRVYFEHDVDFFQPGDGGRQRTSDAQAPNGFMWGVNSLPMYRQSFDDYYLHCYDCVTGETRQPQLPSGLAAAGIYGTHPPPPARSDGLPAPDDLILFPKVRSGRIFIFTNDLSIAPNLSMPQIPAYRCECDGSPTTYAPVALIASGAYGGRGGAGSASNCITHNPGAGNFDCVDSLYTMTGGLSGAGGRGADGGDIYVGLVGPVDPKTASTIQQQVRSASTVKGGTSGSNAKFRTPSTRGPDQANGTRCSFHQDVSAGMYDPAPPGKDGMLTIESLSSIDALDKIAKLLNAKDARTDYNLYSYLQVSRVDPDIKALNASSVLSQFLSSSLAKAEVKFAIDVDKVFGLSQVEDGGYLPPLFLGIATSSLDKVSLVEQQGSLARELQRYDQQKDGIMDVFRRSGGMFHVSSKNTALARMERGQLLVEVAQTNKILAQVNDNLRNIDSQLFSILSGSQINDFKVQLKSLNDELSTLEKQLEQQNNAGLGGLIGALQKCGEAIAGIVKAAAGDNPLDLATSIKSGVDAFEGLFNQGQPTVSVLGITDLKRQIAQVQSDFDSLARFVGLRKQEYLARQYADVKEMMDSRIAYQQKLDSDSFLSAIYLRLR